MTRVLLLQAERRQAAHYEARAYATMNAVAGSAATEVPDVAPELVADCAADEIQAALTLTRRSAESQLDFASTLVSDYPHLLEGALRGDSRCAPGDGDRQPDLTSRTGLRTGVVTEILESASALTTGQLRARLARLVISVDPDFRG